MSAQSGSEWNKNVGGWAWEEKGRHSWAEEWLDEHLCGLTLPITHGELQTTSLTNFSGEVATNLRRGRVICVFDVSFTVNWLIEFDIPETGHRTVTGKVVITDFDSTVDLDDETDLEMDFSANEGELADEGKELAESILRPKIIELLHGFRPALTQQG